MKDSITFDEFKRIEIRVGEIKEAIVPEGSKSLIQLKVDFGDVGERTIFSGILGSHVPENLVGKKRLFVVNLQPKKTPFGMSEGMILAVDLNEKTVLLDLEDDAPAGSEVV